MKHHLLAALLLGSSPVLAVAAGPPPVAAQFGFVNKLFESDFAAASSLSGMLSCAGTPQIAPWKQGLWWEGQSNPAGVAPCSQITLVWDAIFGHRVLDLAWLAAGNHDTFDATTISTFPLDTVSPHFAFRHGYVEVELRLAAAPPGIYGAAYMWGDSSTIFANTPPFQNTIPPAEFDIVELGVPRVDSGLVYDSAIHEWYESGNSAFIAGPWGFDAKQPHRYGFLWVAGAQWQGGWVCSLIDDQWQGCQPTTAASEAGQEFLIVEMGTGCNSTPGDRSCIGNLQRADLYLSRVTVWGK